MTAARRAAQRPITDRELKAWLAAGPVGRGVSEGLTFVASTATAQAGKASWILRFRLNERFKEKVLGRHPEQSLKAAREQARPGALICLTRSAIDRFLRGLIARSLDAQRQRWVGIDSLHSAPEASSDDQGRGHSGSEPRRQPRA